MTRLYRIDAERDAVAAAFLAFPEKPLLALQGEVRPGGPLWIVRIKGARRVLTPMVWGFPPPPGGEQPVFAARNLDSTFWRPWLKPGFRCIAPFSAFFGWPQERGGRPCWLATGAPIAGLAAVWRPYEETPFAALVSAPDASGRAAPLVLTDRESVSRWLEASTAEAVALLDEPQPALRRL